MGYEAYGSGYINYINPLSEEKKNIIEDIAQDFWFDVNAYDKAQGMVDVWYDGNYHDDSVQDFLRRMSEVGAVMEGALAFVGEDDEHWRFVYDTASKSWKEESGHVFYGDQFPVSANDREEFLGQIIDTFEDFLDDKKVTIRNDEKEDSEHDDVNIYGTDYGNLESKLEAIMIRWRVLAPERA